MAADTPKISNLGLRLISTAVMAPLSLALIWFGGWPFIMFIAVGGLLVLYEWSAITNVGTFNLLFGAFALVLSAILSAESLFLWSIVAIFGLAVLLVLINILLRARSRSWGALGIIYTSVPVVALIVLRSDLEFGLYAVAFVMIVVWVTDSAAYGAGRAIGGPKLWPAVSPKKTWAGLAGGVVGAMFAAWIISIFVVGTSALHLALLAGFLALVAQGGDLAASALKRRFGVKDSGFLFPGHGGIIDRVDGLITAVVAATIVGALHAGIEYAANGLLFWA